MRKICLQGKGINWQEVITSATSTEPVCKDYLEVVTKFVREYGSTREEGCSHIELLASFSNNADVTFLHGCHRP